MNLGSIKRKDSHQKDFYCTMIQTWCHSDAHFILQGVLAIMIAARWILMTLMKACENYFQYNSHESLGVVDIKQPYHETVMQIIICICYHTVSSAVQYEKCFPSYSYFATYFTSL